jgi:thioredoxin reductase
MTSPMDLPLHGKVKLYETDKIELLNLWTTVLGKNEINIKENTKVEKIVPENGGFRVITKQGDSFSTKKVLLATGRRGSPRKLNIPGEESTKVAYRLLEPEIISDKKIAVVGGGDSAIESALLLATQNQVTLSYRKDTFSRLKPKNRQKLDDAISAGKFGVLLNSNLKLIEEKFVHVEVAGQEPLQLENDLVYIFAGGELPTQFLKNAGIEITRKYGEAILKHEKN